MILRGTRAVGAALLTLLVLNVKTAAYADEVQAASNSIGGPAIKGVSLVVEAGTDLVHPGSKIAAKITVRNLSDRTRYFTNVEGGGAVYNVIAIRTKTNTVVPNFGYVEGFDADGILGGTAIPPKAEYVTHKSIMVLAATRPGTYEIHLEAFNLIDGDSQERPRFVSNVIRVTVGS